ncbi:MAG TPA: GNAT family N-acetyltransferase [Ktedonobacterales bacterium]|nr:GNAT family N-acetyltransferase [Ktedonobacterales bacterium]
METALPNWQITLNASDAEAAAVLSQDRVWNCFALADLLPPFREYSQVAIARQSGSADFAACLVLRHPALTVISPFGVSGGVAAILARLDLPGQALLQVQETHLPLFQQYYRFQPGERVLLRMAVAAGTFLPPGAPQAQPERLTSADLAAVQALYAHFPENHFRDELLEHGVFYGVRSGDKIVAAGGTHVVAVDYGLAVLGNIFTHPAARRQGYARAITAALVTDLLARGCRNVVLNVVADNSPAITLYANLGFQTHSRYWTMQAERIAAPD